MDIRAKKRIHKILRLCISVAILIFLFSRIDLKTLWHHMRTADKGLLILALGLDFFGQFIMAWQIYLILNMRQAVIRFWNLYKIILATSFVGKFLPTSLGLDTLRMVSLAKATRNAVTSISSILILRVLGVISILLFASVAVISGRYLHQSIETLLVFGLLSLIILILVMGNHRGIRRQIARGALRIKIPEKYVQLAGDIAHSFFQFRGRPVRLGILFLLCMTYQANRVMVNFVVSESMHLGIPLGYFFLFIPVVLVLAMLPLSLGGLGVREGGKVVFLVRMGATTAQAMGVSLIVFGINLVIGLPGGIVYFLEGLSGHNDEQKETVENGSP
ncbi:MAG TPA: flippase-like domain-containing protein [bacterium]|nr:flippase-like domain-containing protein [bacterium]